MSNPSRCRRSLGAAALIAAAVLGAPDAASGCGPSIPRPAFSYNYSPDDRERFLAGDLGVLGAELTAPYLYVAYRHLVGLGLDEASRAAVQEYWQVPETDPWRFDAVRLWTDALREVTGSRPSGYASWQAQVPLTRPDGSFGGFFINCLRGAFQTAVQTLRARAAGWAADAYEPGSGELEAWIEAQETVFGQCGPRPSNESGLPSSSFPRPLAANASPLARADRSYQIAAAHFYARDFETAAARFQEIAADRESPWSDLSAYLVARCLIRSSTVGFEPREARFRQAMSVLDAIVADPSRGPVHEMSRKLRQYVAIRLDPEGTRERLEQKLTAERLFSPFRQNLVDYLWLLNRVPRDEIVGPGGLDRWILVFRRHHDPNAGRRAYQVLETELATSSLPSPESSGEMAEERGDVAPSPAEGDLWLAAGLVLSRSIEPWTAAAMEAAERVPSSSPLFPTLRYHLARLQREAGDYEAARRGLAEARALLADRLSPGDRNRFSLLEAELAPTLDERIERGQLTPIAYTWEHAGRGDQPLATGPTRLQKFAGQTLPADVAVDALNLASSSHLFELLVGETLAPALAGRLAPVAWTRAVLAGEEETALALQPAVAQAAPELADELENYRKAAPGEARSFAAALAILRFPGLRPAVRHGFGRYGVASYWDEKDPSGLDEFSILRDNWWCTDPLHGIGLATLSTLNEKDRAEAERTIARLRNLPPAPTHLGYTILGWAETHRDDPRVPEALHRVVRGGRVCGGGDISRVAHQTLHRRYPKTEWAEKTPYWYK